jgi:hypothetical protein
MRRFPTRLHLAIVAISAALATIVFANLSMPLSAGVAAVVAVGFLAEAWRREDL